MLIHPKAKYRPYTQAAGGWGSAISVMTILGRERAFGRASGALLKLNKPGGVGCVSCAWAKPANPHAMEFCENGAKATAWELTTRQAGPEFFAAHSVSELAKWPDFDLEQKGRLTQPMRYDAASDRYVVSSWPDAYQQIGAQLNSLTPDSVVFYASGRASLETSFMWQLFARAYGTNNLPDSSNMCHESTSIGLQESIGIPVGTVTLEDFDRTDCMMFFGQNVGSNSPRLLHPLQEARKRGVPIISFNPLRERGLERFVNPQSPVEMITPKATAISTQYHQVAIGGDTAAVLGIAKALLAIDDQALARGEASVLDHAFIEQHTEGVEAFIATARRHPWETLERRSGLSRGAMEATARVYADSQRVILIYGMGLTQHRHGVDNVQMLVNLALLRGNIGKPGAGLCPVRGHSNVQGQRTVGISEDPSKVPGARLAELFGVQVPEKKGLATVDACEGMLDGSVRGFISLGGNFLRAVPDTSLMEPAWRNLQLNVQIATKLNRSHLLPGQHSWLLPCLGRIEIDRQNGQAQAHSTEDSTGCVHGWWGHAEPASEHLRSEAAIVAGLAQATLPANPKLDWEAWRGDYGLVRAAIAATWPEAFHDMSERMWAPGGFHRPLPACKREWNTPSKKAQFINPKSLIEDDDVFSGDEGREILQLMTIRSNDQFNTTIYGYEDRFRGVSGSRSVIFMNRDDIFRLGFEPGHWVQVTTAIEPEVQRSVGPLQIIAYDIPQGCCAAYYPECNPLVPLWHHAERSKVPASKSVPVRLAKTVRGEGQAECTFPAAGLVA